MGAPFLAEQRVLGTHILVEAVIVNLIKREQRRVEHLARNPLAHCPCSNWITGNIFEESLAIIAQYLAAAAIARNIKRSLEMRVVGDLAWWVHFTKPLIDFEPDPVKAPELLSKMQGGLNYAEDLLCDVCEFLTGGRPSNADCTMVVFMQFMRYAGYIWISDHLSLWACDERYRGQSAAASLLPM